MILVEVQPAGINCRSTKKKIDIQLIKTTKLMIEGIVTDMQILVNEHCLPTKVKSEVSGPPSPINPCAKEKITSTFMCTHPADLIWLQKLRVL